MSANNAHALEQERAVGQFLLKLNIHFQGLPGADK
jgi:hypothetical protein